MPRITYEFSDGSARTIETESGQSVMQTAVNHNVPGIIGRCGGHCNCGTCHVYVAKQWLSLLPAPSDEEDLMLEGVAADRLANSRLGCQITLTDILDGIVVNVPTKQEFD